ncbi:MAG: alpha/beta fold hydrolase [Roseiflexaceae bacterium]
MQQYQTAEIQDTVRCYRPIDELIPSHWTQGDIIATGIRQHYYRTGRGDKPPLVLLHGILEGALAWLRTARALEQDYDVVMIDTRGHGDSDGIATGYSQALLAADAAGVIRALGLGPARLLGFSQGAGTAILVAAEHPGLIHSLIVAGWGSEEVNTDFTGSPGYQAWLSAYIAWLEQLKTQTHAERMVAALSQLPPGAPLALEDEYVPWVETSARLDLDLVRLGPELWARLGAEVRAMRAALERIDCPVLIMKSEFFPQPGAPQSVREETADRPNVRIIRFENTGHLIYREQFEPFVAITREFFER